MVNKCIFELLPLECSFHINNQCIAPAEHIIQCLLDYQHCVVNSGSKELLHKCLDVTITCRNRTRGVK
jgi:hypothetical protein